MSAFKLSKAERLQKVALHAELDAAQDALEAAVTDFNETVAGARGAVEAAAEAYNEAVEAAREFAQDVAGQAESDISDKSEKWQESERGAAAQGFMEAWSELDLEAVEMDFPEELELPELAHAALIDDAPEEMGA